MAEPNVLDNQDDITFSIDKISLMTAQCKVHDSVQIQTPPDSQEGSDSENESTLGHKPKTISERRRAQNAVMQAFAANLSAHETQKEVEGVSKSIIEQQLSIREILATQASEKRIVTSRDYQTELFQRAKAENIIAVLDTGTGKTHIATLLLKHVLEQELEHRAGGGARRMAFFLVDSVNLVFQQANVLRCGLDQEVEGLCGAMGTSLWDKSTWDKHFDKSMIIVCTAAVLLECLGHSFISMDRINILIFDEAHHAKNNHPYARIMKDFYAHTMDISKRPRVFGMTASPVDVQGQSSHHVQEIARDLERLLQCKIATATDQSLASNNISKPDEENVLYEPLPLGHETDFYRIIKARYGHIQTFEKFFTDAKLYASEVGSWASDMFWSFAFAEEQSQKLQNREHIAHHRTKRAVSPQDLDAKLKILKEATDFVQRHDFGAPTLSDVSSKVRRLHEWLMLYYERSDTTQCIVFVEKRHTARLLKLLFDHIGGPNIHCDVLVGIGSRADDYNVSLRSQVLTLQKFRHGEVNCLFATSVAEEGLDIPRCNLVIRFDLYRTMIGYIQSRGRARHRNSKYLHLLESGNSEHANRVAKAKRDEHVMRDFCSRVARNREDAESQNEVVDLRELDDERYPSYEDPESGAKLTYRMSLSVLNHVVSTWPAPNQESMWQPTYVTNFEADFDSTSTLRSGFVCEVILPEHLPITSMIGDMQPRKIIARCSAAYKMCLELKKKNYLDQYLLPTMHKQLPAQRNALLAVNEKRKGQYPMTIKPDFWKRGRGNIPDHLYLTIVDVDNGLDHLHQPLGILTRVPLPQMPYFPIFLSDGRASNVVSHNLSIPVPITGELLRLVTKCTLQIFEDIYNKVYEYDPSKVSYWVVPVLPVDLKKLDTLPNPLMYLDMKQIQKIAHEPSWQWTTETNQAHLIGRYLIDPLHGGRRYYSDRVAFELTAHDPIPSHVAKIGHKFTSSILEYTDSRWSKSRDMSRWDPDQPVLQVERIPFRRNQLARMDDKEEFSIPDRKAYVCPQPLRISNFAKDFVVACYILPAITHRFESYLIALEACEDLGLKVSPALALEALTKDSENSDEHGGEMINFKSGMGPNYERLEFLGDCFLKMATSISVFVQQPDENEFEFHVRRMVMLCNNNLMETAVGKKTLYSYEGGERQLQLCKYIRTDSFSRRTWYPEGMKLLKGKGLNKSESDWLNLSHNLGDKSIADVCEAFIGAALMQNHTYGRWHPENWDEAVKAVKLFVNSPDHRMSKWSDYYKTYTMPKYQTGPVTASVLDLAQKVEAKHPYKFRHPRLLRSAFIHPSQPFMWELIPNYQRLEFLGDSLLDMVFIMHLFYNYPDKDPQWMTEHKGPMVSNKFLAAVCAKLGWYNHIKQNNSSLTAQIKRYVFEVEEAEREANGAVDYWINVGEPPKCLADVIEAYVAAMFVDAEFDFAVVQQFFDLHLKPFFTDMTLDSYENFGSKHPITRLHRLLSVEYGCSDWCVGSEEIKTVLRGKEQNAVAMVVIHGKVPFHSIGESSRYARVRVSHKALERLDGMPPFEYRRQYGCNCVAQSGVEATSGWKTY